MIIHVHHDSLWHVLRAAYPGGRIVTLCRDAIAYASVLVATAVPHERRCPACAVERRREERAVEIRLADLGGEQ